MSITASEAKSLGATAWVAQQFDAALGHWTRAIAIEESGERDALMLKTLYSNRSAAHTK